VAEDWPASICLAIATASLIGIVNAWVTVDELSWLPDPADAAVSMPIIWPRVLTSGPPESPG